MENLKGSIIKLRKEGKTVNDIKKILGCSKSTISYHLNKNGLGGCLESKHQNINKATDQEFIKEIKKDVIEKIIKLRNERKTYPEILKEVLISKDKLIKICKIFFLNKSSREISDDKKEEIKKLYDKLLSVRKVSIELNLSRQIVRKNVDIKKIIKKTEEYKNKKRVDYVSEFRRNRKIKLVEYKGGKCQCCGYKKSNSALEFHHIDPNEKDFSIGGRNYSFEKMKSEVDKCLLVCSNCHAEIHEELRENGFSFKIEGLINC